MEVRWTRDAAAAALRAWADARGRPPTYNEFQPAPAGCPGPSTLVRLFGSWNAAMAAAGFQPCRPGGYERLRQLPPVRICDVCGERFRKPRRFKFCSASCGGIAAARDRRWSRAGCVAALRGWADEHGRTPTVEEWGARGGHAPAGCPSWMVLHRLFGSWRAAIVAAGLTPRRQGERVSRPARAVRSAA